MSDPKTIAFFPEPGAWGPTNNCVAIANVLAERGHRIVFVVDESFEGELVKRGFEERMMRMAPPEENADPTADPWAEFIRVTAPGVPQAHDRADRDGDEADLGGVGGGRAVLARTDHGDLGRHPARRGVHRQRHRVSRRWSSRARRGSGSSRPTRLEMRDADLPPVLSGPPDRRSEPVARRSSEEYHRQHEDAAGRAQRLPGVGRRGALPDRRVQHELPVVQPVPVPRGGRLRARGAARRDLAPAELDGADERGALRRRRARTRRREGRVPVARLARLHGRRADAAADRRDGRRPSTARSCRWGR